MKILLLTYPYQCVHQFGEDLATSMGYTFIEDPMDISLALTASGPNEAGIMTEYTRSIDYVFPNAVPDDTIISHNVNWHSKLPGNRTEEQFLNDWTGSFDKVIALTTTNLTSSAKNYIATKWCNLEKFNKENTLWEWYTRHDGGRLRDELNGLEFDDYWDDSKLVELRDSHNFLVTYSIDNNITSSNSDSFIHHTSSYEDVNTAISAWDLPDWTNITTSSLLSGSNYHNVLMSHCSAWAKRTY